MKNKYKVIHLQLFYEDLRQIINYIKYQLNNPSSAKKLLNEIEKNIEERSYNPTSYKEYKTNRKRKNPYYKINVKNYIIFYTVTNDVMEIRRILYARRNLEELI
ncbi:MAG: type II toxin-antitoxin system RelE/ParE family toxin [Clostridia bacterium]|jgi:toxin ParE1/3/4|nr:type II toxin-antitoxin system RelE/ParE family toxin [Clostridia bacterium]